MMSYGQLLLTVAPVIALIGLGLLLRRGGWISEGGEETLLTLIVRVLMPALIFESVVGRAVVNGAGDAIAALFFAHCLRTGSAADALSRAASALFGVLKRTADMGSREILLIDAQEELVNPSREFRAEPV